jgi:hypothetical protein
MICSAQGLAQFYQTTAGKLRPTVIEEETEDDTYLQQLNFLQNEPLNLNMATKDQLQLFYFLTELQIENFIRYRNLLGNLISIYELQSVPGWDIQTIYKIRPFVTVESQGVIERRYFIKI